MSVAVGRPPRMSLEEVGPGGAIRLDSVGLTCPIEEFYAGTHLV